MYASQRSGWWFRQRRTERKPEAGTGDDQSLEEFGTLCWGGRLCDDSCPWTMTWPLGFYCSQPAYFPLSIRLPTRVSFIFSTLSTLLRTSYSSRQVFKLYLLIYFIGRAAIWPKGVNITQQRPSLATLPPEELNQKRAEKRLKLKVSYDPKSMFSSNNKSQWSPEK